MAVKQTHIPDIDTIRNLTHKQFYQRIRNRLETLGKSAEWLREMIYENGMPANLKKYTPEQRVRVFEIIEAERNGN